MSRQPEGHYDFIISIEKASIEFGIQNFHYFTIATSIGIRDRIYSIFPHGIYSFLIKFMSRTLHISSRRA